MSILCIFDIIIIRKEEKSTEKTKIISRKRGKRFKALSKLAWFWVRGQEFGMKKNLKGNFMVLKDALY